MKEINSLAAIILAAGKGTRMNSKNMNKVVLRLGSKPMILHTVDLLESLKITPIITVVGFAKESVINILKDRVIYAEQRKLLGSGKALSCGTRKIPKGIKAVLVLNGDDSAFYTKDIISKLISTHFSKKPAITFLTLKLDNPTGLGRVVRNNGKVERIVEEKDADEFEKKIKEILTGCYIFDVDFLKKYLNKIEKSTVTGEYYLVSLIEMAVNSNLKLESVSEENIKWRGINTKDELIYANQLISEN